MKEPVLINTAKMITPLGEMTVAASAGGICLLEFEDSGRVDRGLKQAFRRNQFEIIEGPNSHLELLEKQLAGYFQGKLKNFTVSLSQPGTGYQELIWKIIRNIPYGKTITYQQLHIEAGQSGSVRAAASATGANRIAVVIPCHRVIGSNSSLTGYSGGLARKKWLLDFENEKSGGSHQLSIRY